jgi:hypothetical protein
MGTFLLYELISGHPNEKGLPFTLVKLRSDFDLDTTFHTYPSAVKPVLGKITPNPTPTFTHPRSNQKWVNP